MLRSISSSWRYFIATACFSIALLGAFTYALYQQSQVIRDYYSSTEHNYQTLQKARYVIRNALDMETGQRGYLLTGDSTFLKPYKQGSAEISDSILELQKLVKDEEEPRILVEKTNRHALRITSLIEDQIKTYQKANGKKSLTKADLDAVRNEMDAIRDQMGTFINLRVQDLEKITVRRNTVSRQYIMILLFGALLSIGGVLIANAYIIRLLMRARTTEGKLQQAEERFRLYIENSNEGMYDYNPLTGSMFFSPSHQQLLGYNEKEMGEGVDNFNRLIHPEDLANVWDAFGMYQRQEIDAYKVIFRVKHKNGGWKWVLSRGIGTWDADGKMTRLLGMHSDVTEIKMKETELQELNGDLESFTYIASHDLRSPLVNLKGFAGEMQHTLNDSEPLLRKAAETLEENEKKKLLNAFEKEIPESLGFIGAAVEKMDKLTTSIVDLSRIGKRELKREWVNTPQIVQRCVDALGFEVNQKKIKVVIDPLPQIYSDAFAIEQIFSNIIENAVKYLDPQREGHIHIGSKQPVGEVVFWVKDNGRGIAERDNQKVFDVFRRAGNAGEVRGAGMGMAYIKATLRRLRGHIWFESVLHEGSKFSFSLPLTQDEYHVIPETPKDETL